MGESPNLKRLKAINKQIMEHPGQVHHFAWSNLARTYQAVYKVNREHLIQQLLKPTVDHELAIEMVQNVRPPTIKVQYLDELSRLIHNYAASSFSLVDHTRRLVRKYKGTDFEKEFTKRKKSVAGLEEHLFIQDFRNYVIHYDMPPLNYDVTLSTTGRDGFSLKLDTPTLLKWDGWTPKSKAFIKKQGKSLVLKDVVEKHGKAVDELNVWLLTQFTALHGKDVAERNELMHLRNAILSGQA